MSQKKIVIPNEQEVARFGGDPPPDQPTGSQPASPEQPDSRSPGAGQEAADQAAGPPPPTLETLTAEMEQWKDKCLRARAELLNYQRRVEKDRAESLKYANAGLVKALLPILDDLERVVAAADEQDIDLETVVNGVRLTFENLVKVLRDFGIQRIDAAGKPFDPTQHEAIMQQASPEHAEPTVLSEVARGYRLADRVLRPARVIVASRPAGAPPAGDVESGNKNQTGASAEAEDKE
jgi:molecular chaperone GrpE